MGIKRYISVLCVIPQVVFGQDLSCAGILPDWTLATTQDRAVFELDRVSNLQIMQDSTALNDTSTRAMTLIAPRDTAILVITQGPCQLQDQAMTARATLLTQRGESPIVLSGCCATTDQP